MKPDQLRKLLPQTKLCGIYHLPSGHLNALEKTAKALKYAYFKADLHESSDIKAIHNTLGQALDFPEWYGANLDALSDCLTDFSWREASGYVIVISGTNASYTQSDAFAQTNAVFADAVDEWRSQDIPFWIFYDMRADGLAALPTLA